MQIELIIIKQNIAELQRLSEMGCLQFVNYHQEFGMSPYTSIQSDIFPGEESINLTAINISLFEYAKSFFQELWACFFRDSMFILNRVIWEMIPGPNSLIE